MSGALKGLIVIEMAGLGPCPMAGQMLADHGATVISIDRKSAPADQANVNRRGKKSVAVNLKHPEGVKVLHQLIQSADILIEGFRPGVMEKLGLGPQECQNINPRLIYGRMTGWGQKGPAAMTAGHDLNYLALTGALGAMGREGAPPSPPLNLIADYGGGAMFLIFGVLMALFERSQSGKGQVIDAAMVDGVPAMMGLIHWMLAKGMWSPEREHNLLDGAAPFYRCYETKDGKFISVGAIEPQFYAEFIRLAGLPQEHCSSQNDQQVWAERSLEYEAMFKTRIRDEWTAIFDGSDACVAPVLNWAEIEDHPHNAARGNFKKVEGVLQAAPAPRLERTPADPDWQSVAPGSDTSEILQELGYSAESIQKLKTSGVLT